MTTKEMAEVPPETKVLEEELASIQGILDEGRKRETLTLLEKRLANLDRSKFEGLEEVDSAITDYRDIQRAGMTPEDYTSEKESAFEAIQEALEDLELSEILPVEPPRPPAPATTSANMLLLVVVGISALGVALALLSLYASKATATGLGSLGPEHIPLGLGINIPRVRYQYGQAEVEVRNPGEWRDPRSFIQPYNPDVLKIVSDVFYG